MANKDENAAKKKWNDGSEIGKWDKKDDHVPGEVMLAKTLHIKWTLRDIHDIVSAKDKMLEANPNLGVQQFAMV